MIYLDYAATTPCSREVVEAMVPFFTEHFANASSVDHLPGAHARHAVEHAREALAALVNARPEDVLFTSGSTEANNLVLSSAETIVTSALEHPSILDAAKGRRVFAPVDNNGVMLLDDIDQIACTTKPDLVTIMAVNNEIGTVNNVALIAAIAHRHDACFHSDVTQAALIETIDMRAQEIDAISISAHKIYGPKGVGALICRPSLRRRIRPFMHGGGHERGLRSGTLNVPGIVGFGVAAKFAVSERQVLRQRLQSLRNDFLGTLQHEFRGNVSPTIEPELSAPHILSLRLQGINNRALQRLLAKDLAFSLGSACATNKNEPSHVILGLGLDAAAANETIRLSFGAPTSSDDVYAAARLIAEAGNQLADLAA